MKIVLTGFDPFGGETVNPAWEAVKLVADKIGDAEVVKVMIPTVFGTSAEVLREAIAREKPDAVLCVGQAGGRFELSVERVAINLNDARIADNAGNAPLDETICEDGETAYFATIPVKAIAAGIREAGVPAAVSYTAGTFVCNHLMYSLLYTLNKEYPGVRGGFIHVPFATEQVVNKRNMPAMSVETIARGLEAAVQVIAETAEDIHTVEGHMH